MMETLPLIAVTAVMTLVVFALGAWSMRWWLQHRPAQEAPAGEKRCSICAVALSPKALRTHRGHWRCREHKDAA